MEFAANNRPDLAAALFRLMGATVPVQYSVEEEARELYSALPNDQERLRKVIALCGEPKTPQQLYLAARAGSWLGGCDQQTAKYAQAYLETTGWSQLPAGSVVEEGITVNRQARHRAHMYAILAQAQENLEKHETALTNYTEAYRLEPYEAMYAIKIADIIAKCRSRKEALRFLQQQKLTHYYRPVSYLDEHGNRSHNRTFQQVINSHILKLEAIEE